MLCCVLRYDVFCVMLCFGLCCVLGYVVFVFCCVWVMLCLWWDTSSVLFDGGRQSNGDTSPGDRASIRDWV